MWRQGQKGPKSLPIELVGKQMMTERKAGSQNPPQGIDASTSILRMRNMQERKSAYHYQQQVTPGWAGLDIVIGKQGKGNDKHKRWCRIVSVKLYKCKNDGISENKNGKVSVGFFADRLYNDEGFNWEFLYFDFSKVSEFIHSSKFCSIHQLSLKAMYTWCWHGSKRFLKFLLKVVSRAFYKLYLKIHVIMYHVSPEMELPSLLICLVSKLPPNNFCLLLNIKSFPKPENAPLIIKRMHCRRCSWL